MNRFISSFSVLLFGILSILVVSSCSKDPIRPNPGPIDPPSDDSTTFSKGFFIVNEGNFNWGNASVTYIDNSTGTAHQNVFQEVNHRPLGDVAQSMKIMNSRGYIVINASNRVEVVDLKDFKTIKSIEGFNSPRYIEFVDSTKAYVTNLYKDISVVDLVTMTITKTIQTPEWTEGMVKYNNYMFVTCIGEFTEPSSKRKAKLLILDTKEDKIIDSIPTATEPIGIVIDKKMKLWVLCSGGWDGYAAPALIRVNPDLRQVEKAFSFSSADIPSRLDINPSRDTIYYLQNGIYQMPVTASSAPSQPLVSSANHLFYGMAIHPVDGTIFATDAIDYVQSGDAFQYSSSTGAQLNSWETGRIPSSFCFGETQISKK
ncbi:MAG: YncE family protein [Bacteroidales bacterium]|nr:YncE family protein [Bacteroidales bacterium]